MTEAIIQAKNLTGFQRDRTLKTISKLPRVLNYRQQKHGIDGYSSYLFKYLVLAWHAVMLHRALLESPQISFLKASPEVPFASNSFYFLQLCFFQVKHYLLTVTPSLI